MWTALSSAVSSATNVIVKLCSTLEKGVGLVEAEVDNLATEQQIRMDAIIAERQSKRLERERVELEEEKERKKLARVSKRKAKSKPSNSK